MKVKGDYFLPYNPELVKKAKEMRQNPTPAEFKMWYFLRFLSPRFLRQRPIDSFIVDFYCPELNLAIEIDGDPHFTEEGKVRDAERTQILNSHGLKVIRFSNSEVLNNFEIIKKQISELIKA
ncbi:MAG: endonuclease domain-containing protein [Patescibacteria group bacterium]|nr:endonuclease domain-containing protein [Patescibacteria group bacterium]